MTDMGAWRGRERERRTETEIARWHCEPGAGLVPTARLVDATTSGRPYDVWFDQ